MKIIKIIWKMQSTLQFSNWCIHNDIINVLICFICLWLTCNHDWNFIFFRFFEEIEKVLLLISLDFWIFTKCRRLCKITNFNSEYKTYWSSMFTFTKKLRLTKDKCHRKHQILMIGIRIQFTDFRMYIRYRFNDYQEKFNEKLSIPKIQVIIIIFN